MEGLCINYDDDDKNTESRYQYYKDGVECDCDHLLLHR